MRRAIREHRRDFAAIIGLMILAVFTSAVIFSQQRLTLPGWVPVIGSDRFELEVELTSAQAVTPGQGQSLNIAGIKVGDVSEVNLEDGRAIVTAQLDPDDAELIHEDATVLLRPRTGLQDMTLELDVGTEEAPVIEEGYRITAESTAPNVQPDEILASLDGDTQAYLQLLIQGGAEGLGGSGKELSATLRRIEPLARDLARLNSGLADRRNAIKHAITSFRDVSEELGASDTQLAEFVSSSNEVMDSFARQEASLRASLRELPGALEATRGALESGESFGRALGPAARALIPSAEALGPALREVRPFLDQTTQPIREQIRPFTRQTSDALRHIRQGSKPLAGTTKGLSGGLSELNKLLNALAYNPAGPEEGYLFWLAWLNHNTNNMFMLQDALGPLRRGLVIQNCLTATVAEGLAAERPFLRTLQQLTNVPMSSTICPITPLP
jgi:phospholipid/cholesterol/gamma-HCH transport system substrate-binding protein